MGLGLTICKQLTERLKGTIKVESQLGEGTAFIFSILNQEADQPVFCTSTHSIPTLPLDPNQSVISEAPLLVIMKKR